MNRIRKVIAVLLIVSGISLVGYGIYLAVDSTSQPKYDTQMNNMDDGGFDM